MKGRKLDYLVGEVHVPHEDCRIIGLKSIFRDDIYGMRILHCARFGSRCGIEFEISSSVYEDFLDRVSSSDDVTLMLNSLNGIGVVHCGLEENVVATLLDAGQDPALRYLLRYDVNLENPHLDQEPSEMVSLVITDEARFVKETLPRIKEYSKSRKLDWRVTRYIDSPRVPGLSCQDQYICERAIDLGYFEECDINLLQPLVDLLDRDALEIAETANMAAHHSFTKYREIINQA